MTRRRLSVISHVSPVPGASGQSQRVLHTLAAARHRFHVRFVTTERPGEREIQRDELASLCDELVLLPARRTDRSLQRRIAAALYVAFTGLKPSNYWIGRLEFSPTRVQSAVRRDNCDCALFEYWHAWRAAEALRLAGVPAVVDTHNVLAASYQELLRAQRLVPAPLRSYALSRYAHAERTAWRAFDALIAINRDEYQQIRDSVPSDHAVFYAPMGIDLSRWPYCWRPESPPRVAYYGGMGSPRNQSSAIECLRQVMPTVWASHPDARLWIVGSNPPPTIRNLEADARVRVTGFVDEVGPLLGTMSVVLCPFSGTYGFRSRVVEVLAAGAPMVAFHDAVAGMDLVHGDGISLVSSYEEMTRRCIELLSEPERAASQSVAGRRRVEAIYSMEATYGRLMAELDGWLDARSRRCS